MMAGSIFVFAFVLVVVPLLAGVALILSSRRGGLGFPACGACHYNLTATAGRSTICPECGADILQVGIIPPRGQRNPALLWSGVGLIALALTCVGGGLMLVLPSHRQAMPASRAVPAAAPPIAPPAQPAAAAPETPAGEIPPPLTQAEIDAMTVAEVRDALGRVSKARSAARRDPQLEERLRTEFNLLMNRLRTLQTTEP